MSVTVYGSSVGKKKETQKHVIDSSVETGEQMFIISRNNASYLSSMSKSYEKKNIISLSLML